MMDKKMRIECERKMFAGLRTLEGQKSSWRDQEWKDNKIKIFNFIKSSENLSGKLVLNVGCGRDILYNYFEKENSVLVECDIIGESLIELKSNGVINLIRCDAHYLPFKTDIFDLVFCIELIHHLHPIEEPLAELIRVLKKNHNFYCVEPNKYAFISLPFAFVSLQLRNRIRYFLYSRIFDTDGPPASYEYPLSAGEIKQAMIKNGIKLPMENYLYKASPDVPKFLFMAWNLIGTLFDKFSFEVMVYGRKE
ncbi:MAG: class I SAM-dependent methyltransferase [Candidatus Methanoperedens sp.]|nr:class I SAM-dependent methyltransferase [Candidatus Methanoperedens sp.]